MKLIYKLSVIICCLMSVHIAYSQNNKSIIQIIDSNEEKTIRVLLKQSLLKELLLRNYLIQEDEIINTYRSFDYLDIETLDKLVFSRQEKIVFYMVKNNSKYNFYLDSVYNLQKTLGKKFNISDIKYFFNKYTFVFAVDYSYNYVEFYRLKGFACSEHIVFSENIKKRGHVSSLVSEFNKLLHKYK